MEALRPALSPHDNHKGQLLEETSAWEKDISRAFRVAEDFQGGDPSWPWFSDLWAERGGGVAVLEVITQKLPSENQSVGPGPLGGIASVLPPGRPFSPLEHGNPQMGSLQSLPASPSPEQQRGGRSPLPRLVLRLALQPWLGSATLLSRCCQMLGCKRLRGAPGHTPEAGPRSSWRRTAPVGSRGWMQSHTWCTCPQPFAASSPLEDPDFVDGCQGGRHVGLEVPIMYPGLPKSPRRRVVLPVVVPVAFAVRPEAIQVHLPRAEQR